MAHDPVLDPSNLARAAERLASLIPGYTGYKERERLREEDRAVRDAVVRQLGLVLGRLERALSSSIRLLSPSEVEEADKVLRGLGRHRDRIRFAPAGYTSLFARRKVQKHELEGLLALDTGLWAALEELDRVAAEWDLATRHGESSWPSANVKQAMQELEDVLDERESYLRS
jgi:hypothetical protein